MRTPSLIARFVTLILLTLSSFKVCSSPQMPDYIIYKNDTIPTYNLLVELYLKKHDEAKREQLFGLTFRDGASFNCWRGYQAIYKIENDSLFVSSIIECGELRSKSFDSGKSLKRLKAIFGDRLVDGKVFIDWFSGALSFPLTNKVLRWDGVFYKIYEQETVIHLYSGKLLNAENVSNYVDDPKAIDRRYGTKISDILFSHLRKLKFKRDCDCSEKYLITIDEEGRISNVKTTEHKSVDEISDSEDRKEYVYCTNTIRKALSSLKFDVIKNKGIPMSEDIYLEIWIEENGKIENWTN